MDLYQGEFGFQKFLMNFLAMLLSWKNSGTTRFKNLWWWIGFSVEILFLERRWGKFCFSRMFQIFRVDFQ